MTKKRIEVWAAVFTGINGERHAAAIDTIPDQILRPTNQWSVARLVEQDLEAEAVLVAVLAWAKRRRDLKFMPLSARDKKLLSAVARYEAARCSS